VQWIETCFCAVPLDEERPYWEAYFDLETVKDAHDRAGAGTENGDEPWAWLACDCTRSSRGWLRAQGRPFRPRRDAPPGRAVLWCLVAVRR
jgi:hypothetical protein